MGPALYGCTVTLDAESGMTQEVPFRTMEDLEIYSFNFLLRVVEIESWLSTLVACFLKDTLEEEIEEEKVGSKIRRSSFLHFLLLLKDSDIFAVYRIFPTWFACSERAFEPCETYRWNILCTNVVLRICQLGYHGVYYASKSSCSITSDSERKHNPGCRRSGSCETVESMNSFQTDSVVDWKDLLYGYN